jgi:hypothetical protein
MGICHKFIKTDYSRCNVEGIKGLRAQNTYFMLEKQ